jgi:hypothetical protein
MQLTPLPLETLLNVLQRVEAIHPVWTEIWSGHFNHLNKVLGIDYIQRLKTLVEKLLDPKENYPSQVTDIGKARHKLTFDPHIAVFEGQQLIFNPANLRA